MTKVNPNSRNEAKSDILLWGTFKSDIIYFFYQKVKVFHWLSKSKFLIFMTEGNPNNRDDGKSDIFS